MASDSLLLLHRQLAGVQQQQQQQASQHQQQMPTRRPISLNSPLPSTSAGASAGPSSVAELVEEARAPAQQRPEDPAVPEAPVPKRKSRFKEGSAAKRSKTAATHEPPATLLRDLGGIDKCVESILELVALPLCHPEIYLHTGVRPPRGVLLVGPPGCGKTMLAGAIAGELKLPFISISAPSIVSGMSGESEKALRETFEEAARHAPCILFIDEIDAITPKRETAQREMERRIVAQLLTCMDDLAWEKTDNKPVMILGATNRPDSLDPALRRAGRFDAEVSMGVPDEEGREKILRVLLSKLRLSGAFDYQALARQTPGYVGADLSALTGAAGVFAVKRIFDQLGAPSSAAALEAMHLDEAPEGSAAIVAAAAFQTLPDNLRQLPISRFLSAHPESLSEEQLATLAITNDDFTAALATVQPSSQREGFTTVPDVTWDDLGALNQIQEEIRMSIVRPIQRPELFASLGIQAPCGVLLWGPPGCGKTLLAKAVANESHANFISIKGPELLNKYVGESERAVRQVFNRARASSPCIIFFDELDALVPRRDDSLSESSARVVNTLLTELDGLEPRKQVFVIGATNRPDVLDPAMIRPGRLDKLLFVDLPSPAERFEILKAQTRKTPMHDGIDLEVIAADAKCDGFSGADLSALVREAAVQALRETFAGNSDDQPIQVEMRHLRLALQNVQPSVHKTERRRFDLLRKKFSAQPLGHREDVAE